MKYCENCGFQMFDRETRCPNCGNEERKATKANRLYSDSVSIGGVLLTLLFPIAGLILWAKKKENQPNAAKRYLILGITLWIINFVLVWQSMNRLNESIQRYGSQTQYEEQYDDQYDNQYDESL